MNNTQVPFNAIETSLKAELKKDPNSVVMLRFDNTLSIQDLVDVLSLGTKLNVKMMLATAKIR